MPTQDLTKVTNTNILIICQTASKFGIRWQIVDWDKYKVKLDKNHQVHFITKKSLGINSSKAIKLVRNKHQTYLALKQAKIPVLKQIAIKHPEDYPNKAKQIPFPQVIKPTFGEKGKNIYLNITDLIAGQKAINQLLKISPAAVVETYFPSPEYRIMILDNQVIGLSQRLPPTIIGNGKKTIKQLIEQENQRRLQLNKSAGRRMLNRLLIWKRIKWYLGQQGLSLTDIPGKNQTITIYPISNFSTGGSVKTLELQQIHRSYLKLAVKAVQAVGLTIGGVDFLIKNINQPAEKDNCAIIEINSDPGLRLHEWPNQGKPQRAAEKILKYIFSKK